MDEALEFIRFNKPLKKLKGKGSIAKLLYTSFINLETLEMAKMYKDLLEYDCKIEDEMDYQLEPGVYIICLLQDEDTGELYTTLKVNTEAHIKKYFGGVGKRFCILRNFEKVKDGNKA